MNGTTQQLQAHEGLHPELEKSHGKIVAGGSMVEALGGIAAVVLTIVALAGVYPGDLAAIAAIGIGASLLFEGGAVGARFSRLLSSTGSPAIGTTQFGGGLTAEFLGGAAGIVLGLLSLLRVAPAVLPPIAVIVFGGALLLGSGATSRLNFLEITARSHNELVENVAQEAVSAAAGAQVLTGLAAVLLGILALVGISATVLTLVALLCIGVSVVMSGSAITSRILGLMVG